MGVKIINLPEFTGLPESGDYLPVSDGTVTSKLNYSLLAQAIVENYEASELAGEERSPKAAIDVLAGLLSQAQTDIENLQTATTTIETLDIEYSSAFEQYTNGGKPHFTKFGRVVTCTGTAKPTATIEGGTTAVTMFTIPEGWRPAYGRFTYVMPGSGAHLWVITIINNGVVTFSRNRNGDTWAESGTSEWLPFTLVYICEEPPVAEESSE